MEAGITYSSLANRNYRPRLIEAQLNEALEISHCSRCAEAGRARWAYKRTDGIAVVPICTLGA